MRRASSSLEELLPGPLRSPPPWTQLRRRSVPKRLDQSIDAPGCCNAGRAGWPPRRNGTVSRRSGPRPRRFAEARVPDGARGRLSGMPNNLAGGEWWGDRREDEWCSPAWPLGELKGEQTAAMLDAPLCHCQYVTAAARTRLARHSLRIMATALQLHF